MDPQRQAILRQATQATNLRYGAQQRNLQGLARGSVARQGNIQNWFANYHQAVATAQQQQAAANQAAQQRIDQLMQNTGAANQQVAGQIQQQQAQNQAVTGAVQQPNVLGAQAAASRRNLQDVFGAAQASQGASQAGYLADVGRIGRGSEVAAHGAEAKRTATIQQQIADLQGEKGQYKQQQIANLQAAAQKYGLALQSLGLQDVKSQRTQATAERGQNIASRDRQAALGVQKQKLQDQLANSQTNREKTQAQTKIYQWNLAHPNHQISSGGGKGAGKLTAGQTNVKTRLISATDHIRNTGITGHGAIMKELMKDTTVVTNPKTGAKKVYHGLNSLEARAVADHITFGKLQPGTKKQLQSVYGISDF